MLFLLTLIFVGFISVILSKVDMKKLAIPIYIISLLLNIISIYLSFYVNIENNIYELFIKIMKQGLIGMAFLVIIMMIGAMPKSKTVIGLFKIRGELSILAVIFMLNHFVYYMIKIIQSLPNWSNLTKQALLINMSVSVLSIWAWIICIPLFITSFRCIRKQMDPKSWKNLQRYAYIMYALVYVHIVFAFLSKPNPFNYGIDLLIYSLIFLVYFILRFGKYIKKKRSGIKLRLVYGFASLAFILIIVAGGYLLHRDYVKFVIAQEMQKKALEELKQKKEMQLAQDSTDEEDVEYLFKDGEYEGVARGYNGNLSVLVTVKKDQILDIKFLINNDDGEYVEKAKGILTNIMVSNSTQVDIVSGATVTSKAIIKATEDALIKAEKANEE